MYVSSSSSQPSAVSITLVSIQQSVVSIQHHISVSIQQSAVSSQESGVSIQQSADHEEVVDILVSCLRIRLLTEINIRNNESE